jgi:hypothetical protein
VKVVATTKTTHNPFNETHRVSCLRENLTSSSDGEGLETGCALSSVPRQSFTRQPLHERIKQFLGAEDSQLQTEAGVRRHLTLVFVVNSLLKSRDSESTHWGSANDRVPRRVAHVWSTLSSHPV